MAKTKFVLDEKDHAICSLSADGKNTGWIAKKLELSVRTVENRILEVRKKTKTKNKTHLMCYLIREGLI